MGQQQLLLLVLGIVIVGLAVVVGIQAFGENQKKANQDALVNDGVRIASDAQAWVLKPEAFGGGAGDFSGLTWTSLGYESNAAGDYENINGEFEMGTPSAAGVVFTGTSYESDGTTVENQVFIAVCGTEQEDITTQIGGTAPTC